MSQFVYLLQWIAPTVPEVAEVKDKLAEQIPTSISMKELKNENERYQWTEELDSLWDKALQERHQRSTSATTHLQSLYVFLQMHRMSTGVV